MTQRRFSIGTQVWVQTAATGWEYVTITAFFPEGAYYDYKVVLADGSPLAFQDADCHLYLDKVRTPVFNLTGREVDESDHVWWNTRVPGYYITRTPDAPAGYDPHGLVWLGRLDMGVFAAVWMGLAE